MSRVLTRALLISTVGGLAVAPALAYAATDGPSAPATTVTTLTTPKHTEAGMGFMLSAKVSPQAPAAATGGEQPTTMDKPDCKPEPAAKQGKGGGATKGKKKHHPRHQHAETGSITFSVDGKQLAPVPLNHDRASEQLELPAGKHTVSATYSGDSNFRSSQSEPLSFIVT